MFIDISRQLSVSYSSRLARISVVSFRLSHYYVYNGYCPQIIYLHRIIGYIYYWFISRKRVSYTCSCVMYDHMHTP
jgi:hypothetical protein